MCTGYIEYIWLVEYVREPLETAVSELHELTKNIFAIY